MLLVHKKKGFTGKWEVAWTWLPYFLASDRDLHKEVDQKMTVGFKGMSADPIEPLLTSMNERVKEIILARHPIAGLKVLLDAYGSITLEEEP